MRTSKQTVIHLEKGDNVRIITPHMELEMQVKRWEDGEGRKGRMTYFDVTPARPQTAFAVQEHNRSKPPGRDLIDIEGIEGLSIFAKRPDSS